jgi:DNA polymerase III subunit epsilon
VSAAESSVARAYRETPLPEAGLGWREATFAVLDFETTGLDRDSHEIISFATVTVAEGRVSLADARHELVRPRRMPDADSIRIHGLRESDLADAPPLAEQLDLLLEALTGRVIVAHVASVERGFLGAALAERGLEVRNPFVDTAFLDRELRRLRQAPAAEQEPIGLSAMARELGLPVHRPHHADGDALTTAQAFVALATHLDEFRPQTVGSLERISKPESRGHSLRGVLHRLGLGRDQG